MNRSDSLRIAIVVAVTALALTTLGHAAGDKMNSKAYREAAFAHFKKRCNEDAGVSIRRVVDDVEAIYLANPRQRATEAQLRDQYWMGDPYGHSTLEASNPAAVYLYDRTGKTISGLELTPIKGYRAVETPNPRYGGGPNDARYLRYKLAKVLVENTVTKKKEKRLLPQPMEVMELESRYAIEWKDISTKEDRQFWVAGGQLVITDMVTSEVIAVRTGYVIDPRFGDVNKGRAPWLAVGLTPKAFCPGFESRYDRNKEFVARVLQADSGFGSGVGNLENRLRRGS